MGNLEDKKFLDQFMPWICKWANKCATISKYIDFEDLQSVGMMAAFEGRDTFKEGKDTKLNTHIMNMIKFRILRHANGGKDYSLSQNNHILAIKKARKILGEDATAEEISEWMKGHYSDRASMLIPSTIEDLERVANTKHTSIQALQEAEGIQPDRYMPAVEYDFEDMLHQKMELEQLDRDLSTLSEQEQIVVAGRKNNKTLDEIAKDIGRTRERVRQVEVKAIRNLKAIRKSRELRNENYITGSKRNDNRLHGSSLRRHGNVSGDEGLLDSGRTSVIDRPGRETPIEPQGYFKGKEFVIFESEYTLAPNTFKLLQYLKNTTERRRLQLAKGIKCSHKTVYNGLDELKNLNILDSDLVIQDPQNWRLHDDGREIKSSAETLWGSSKTRQVSPDRITTGTVDQVRDEPVPKLESKEKNVESSNMEVLHSPPKRRKRALHIPKVQKRSDDRSDVSNVTVGQIVCNGLYEVLEILIPGLQYEVVDLASGKHRLLKASEVF